MLHRMVRCAVLLGVAGMLAACAARRPVDGGASREAREAMLFTVAQQLHESQSTLDVTRFERVVWRDSCLEIRQGSNCLRERTPGYRLRFTRRGQSYEYRAPAGSPTDVALAAAPDPRIGVPALAWRWAPSRGACQTLLISADARPAIGWCDGPLIELNWLPELQSRDEWLYLYRRFAPFRLLDGERGIVFSGVGTEPPSIPWQRAVEAWAALRWSDLRAGRSGAAHGRAMAFRRPIPDRAGYCDILEVTEYGRAYAGTAMCEGGGGEPGRTAWLSDDLWNAFGPRLYMWSGYSDEARGVHFFGKGAHRLTEGEVSLVEDWARRAIADVRRSGR